jgi:TRAP-type mannitol/chloroaromatic compound transport system permease small subunit/ethanolamine utilization microcompartment shell protein EutS
MPNLTFILPHWVYWSGLILIPLFAMFTVQRQKRRGAPAAGISLAISYMLWLTGGFVGLHRFYLRSALGAIYILLFVVILYANVQSTAARDAVSHAGNDLLGVKVGVDRAQAALAIGIEGSVRKLAEAEQALAAASDRLAAAQVDFGFWQTFTGGFVLVIAALLLIDAFLLPRLMRRCAEREGASAQASAMGTYDRRVGMRGGPAIHTWFTDTVDSLNGWIGNFVCYWSVIAVFVYYYEVLARYVFNSPTNWAHEGMFLMFGMQYLISGGFTLREDGHVRVDVIYLQLPKRVRAVIDVLTSIFFFLFCGALLWTGWNFMMDSISVWEVSFTEWAIQYWPVKSTIAIGAILILLQGFAKLIKDVLILAGKEA